MTKCTHSKEGFCGICNEDGLPACKNGNHFLCSECQTSKSLQVGINEYSSTVDLTIPLPDLTDSAYSKRTEF